jgi:hypothetical protein
MTRTFIFISYILQLVLNYVHELYKLSRDDLITILLLSPVEYRSLMLRCSDESAFCTKEFVRSFQSTCM